MEPLHVTHITRTIIGLKIDLDINLGMNEVELKTDDEHVIMTLGDRRSNRSNSVNVQIVSVKMVFTVGPDVRLLIKSELV